MLEIFYQSVVGSAIYCAVVCCSAASVPEIFTGSINSFARPELSLVKT